MEKSYIESNACIISINRGDSFQGSLFINDGSILQPNRHELTADETVYLGVIEPNKFWEQAILKQVYDSENRTFTEDGDMIIKIRPEDTEYLVPGPYYYMIKLVKKIDGQVENVRTVVPMTPLFIL